MLSADEVGATVLRASVEVVEPIAHHNALTVDSAHSVWTSGAGEPSGVGRIRGADLTKRYGWITSGAKHAGVNWGDTPKRVSSPASHWVRTLRTDMQQFQVRTETEIARLSSAVETLAKAVASFHYVSAEDDDPPLFTVNSLLASEMADEELATTLNSIADLESGWTPEWSEIAQQKLAADNPLLRAAAARALAVHDKALANQMLPARVEAERNKFVRSILRSALTVAVA